MFKKIKIFNRKKSFKQEFKSQLRLAIAAAVGFTIAFAWKDYISFQTNTFIQNILVAVPYLSRFIGAFLITLIGVIIILISSKLLR